MKKTTPILLFLILISAITNQTKAFNYTSSKTCVIITKDDKYGILDLNSGKIIAKCIYDSFDENAFAWKNGKCGVLNFETGEEEIPMKYSYLELHYSCNQLRYKAGKDEKFGVIDSTGKIILPFKYENICDHGNNLWEATYYDKKKPDSLCIDIIDICTAEKRYNNDQNKDVLIDKTKDTKQIETKNGKYGVKDIKTGNFIIPPQFSKIEKILDTYYYVTIYVNKEQAPGSFTIKYTDEKTTNYKQNVGLYDINGKELLPCEYDHIEFNFNPDKNNDNHYFRISKDLKVGIINAKTGKVTVPLFFGMVDNLKDDYAIMYSHYNSNSDKMGLINVKTGKIIFPIIYESLYRLQSHIKPNDFFIVRKEKNAEFELIDQNGKQILPFTVDNANDISKLSNNRILVKRFGQQGVYTTSGEEILPTIYDNISIKYAGHDVDKNMSQPVYHTVKNGKVKYIDFDSSTELKSFVCGGETYLYQDTLFVAYDNNNHKRGIINAKTGKEAIPFEYDEIILINKELALLHSYPDQNNNNRVIKVCNPSKGEITGIIPGKEIYHPYYEDMYKIDENIVFKENGKVGIYNLKSNKITILNKYDDIRILSNCNNAIISFESKYGILNIQTGETIVPFEYDNMCLFEDFFP